MWLDSGSLGDHRQQAQRFLMLSVPLQFNHFHTCHQAHKTTTARLSSLSEQRILLLRPNAGFRFIGTPVPWQRHTALPTEAAAAAAP